MKSDRTYAVGVLCLRQSGALLSNRVRFFRATRGKTAHGRSVRTMLPQAKAWCCDAEERTCVSPTILASPERRWPFRAFSQLTIHCPQRLRLGYVHFVISLAASRLFYGQQQAIHRNLAIAASARAHVRTAKRLRRRCR